MSTISPNMNLTLSTINVDSGLNWETNLNLSLTTIDSHNHTPGSGVPIPVSGLNINADLSLNNFNLTDLRSVRFTAQNSPLSLGTDLGCLYESGVDLWYNDGAGNQIKLTSGGSVNATSSGISSGTASAAFSGGVLVVNANTLTPANIQVASVLLGNNIASSNYVTLSPPNALASSYNLTLPLVPASQSFMAIDASGNMTAYTPVSGGIKGSNIASATITSANIAALTITGSNLANQTITATQIANQTITATQIANQTITATQIANGTITHTQIAAGTVTPANQAASVSGTQTVSSSTGITSSSSAPITLSLTSGRAVIITLSTVNAQGISGDIVSSGSNNVSIFKNGVALATIYQATAATNHPAINFSFIDTVGGNSAITYDLRTNTGTYGPNASQSVSMVFSAVQV